MDKCLVCIAAVYVDWYVHILLNYLKNITLESFT